MLHAAQLSGHCSLRPAKLCTSIPQPALDGPTPANQAGGLHLSGGFHSNGQMTSRYYLRLVRHGETEANVKRILEAHTPTPLNERGRRQASALGEALRAEGATFRLVVSSDTTRAMETCRLAVGPDTNIRPEPQLRERECGSLDGLTYDEGKRRQQEAIATGTPIDGMETTQEASERVARYFHKLSEEMLPEGGEVAVFSHAALIYYLISYLQKQLGLELSQHYQVPGRLNMSWNTGQTRLLVERSADGRISVSCLFLYRDSHLTGDLAPEHYLLPYGETTPREKTQTDVNGTV